MLCPSGSSDVYDDDICIYVSRRSWARISLLHSARKNIQTGSSRIQINVQRGIWEKWLRNRNNNRLCYDKTNYDCSTGLRRGLLVTDEENTRVEQKCDIGISRNIR